jgi:hypothetical protein
MESSPLDFRKTIKDFRFPHTTVARLAHVPDSRVSEYARGARVSVNVQERIELAVDSLWAATVLSQALISVRPDMSDIVSLQELISEIYVACAQWELAQAEQQVREALREMGHW